MKSTDFILLVLSTVFMAAFGYIFNDVMDEEVDQINKEEKRMIGKQFSKASALLAGRAFWFSHWESLFIWASNWLCIN